MGRRQVRTRGRNELPDWLLQLMKDGKAPERGTSGYHTYVGWKFFDDVEIPGLPPEGTPERDAIIKCLREAK